jgi:hypothetical protein
MTTPEIAGLCERLRGEYRIPITDGLGPAGGEEPENAREFVRRFETAPIQHEAADTIERQAAEIERLRVGVNKVWTLKHIYDCQLTEFDCELSDEDAAVVAGLVSDIDAALIGKEN